jgi:tetratricopeptide (TPR) repeat protein/cold shock CspA family protein
MNDREGHVGDLDTILADVRSLAKRGDHRTIIARYGALDDTPTEETWNSTDLLYEIGRAFGMLGNEDKVERYLLRCAELAPRRAAVFHCAIGWYFQRKKKWTKALRWYDRALASFPTYHLCLFRRGYCLEKLHRPREAAEALGRARTIWDQAPAEQRQRGRGVQVQVLFHLSRGLRDLGDFDAAAEALDVCCDLDRASDPPAIRGEHTLACRGELHLRRGDLEAALAAFAEARDLDPSSSYVWERLGRVHELRGEVSAAEAAYRHATTLPRGAFAFLALGRFYLHTADDAAASAAALLEALRRVWAAEPLIRMELARLQLACARPNAALLQVERALACRRDNAFVDGLRLAAELAEQVGRIDTAANYLRELVRLAPDDPALAERLGALESPASTTAPAAQADRPLPPALALLEDAALEVPGRERQIGVVDRFFADKGFGFLTYEGGQSIFFHVTQCEDVGTAITPGIRVSFLVGHNAKKGKPQAEAVKNLD